jgi:hypothetical protein
LIVLGDVLLTSKLILFKNIKVAFCITGITNNPISAHTATRKVTMIPDDAAGEIFKYVDILFAG